MAARHAKFVWTKSLRSAGVPLSLRGRENNCKTKRFQVRSPTFFKRKENWNYIFSRLLISLTFSKFAILGLPEILAKSVEMATSKPKNIFNSLFYVWYYGRIPNDPMPNDPIPNDPMPNDPMPNDPMPNDPMPNDPMPNVIKSNPMPNVAECQMPNAEQLKLKEIAGIIIVPTLPNLT
jgi:hypothetical protein